jgi:adenosylhomocysteine nucleosidase
MSFNRTPVSAAFVYALTVEVKPLLKQATIHKKIALTLGGNPILIQFATFLKTPVVFCRTGIGIAAAHEAAEALLEQAKPSVIVSLGCAGACHSDLHTGDLVFADTILSETPTDNFSTTSGETLENFARTEKIPSRRGPLMTLWKIAGKSTKENASSKGAIAVDMETAAVAAIAEKAGIPLLSMRAIFDRLEETIPSEEPFDEAHPIAYLLRNPKMILKIPRYARANALCGKNLLRVVTRFVDSLAGGNSRS